MSLNLLDSLKIDDKIASGSFGDVYKGKLEQRKVAIKFESVWAFSPLLAKEARTVQSMKDHPNIPKIYWRGQYSEHNILVMKLYGPNLRDILNIQKELTLQTALKIGTQLLEAIQHVHTSGYIHRDIKPSNILTHKSRIVLTDFGISKPFAIKGTHIPYRESLAFVGTLKFCSLNSHLGVEQSRRDDLESIGYTLIFLLKGCLPWEKCKSKDIYNNKLTKLREACQDLPSELLQFVMYARNLAFYKEPDYLYLKELLNSVATANHLKLKSDFEWRRYNNVRSLPLEHTEETLLDSNGPCPINREKVLYAKKNTL